MPARDSRWRSPIENEQQAEAQGNCGPRGRQLARDNCVAAGLVSHVPEFTVALRRYCSIGKCRAEFCTKLDFVPGLGSLGSEGVQCI